MDNLTKPQSDLEWMVVYVADNQPEAHVVAGRLHSMGIEARVHQEPFGSAVGITFGALGEVRVLVLSSDYDRAMAILDEDVQDSLVADTDEWLYIPPEDDDIHDVEGDDDVE